ncbi:MAG TPA: ATP-binding protein, partial [Candidatus Binataceae bacterium]
NAASGRRHAAESELAAAYTAAAKLPPRRRFAGLGEILAQAGAKVESAAGSKPGSKPAPFDGWILAVRRRGQLEVVAASAEIALPFELAQNSALARCLECGATIECARGATVECAAAAAHSTAVWRLFKHPYICVPLDAGAIALAARGGVDDAARRRAEALAARLAPLLRAWLVEEEAAEYRALVGRLALRMFAAADEERARIARDLHDDQAQLLAAAKIALAGGREQARAIFKQLEDELCKRTRLLRPAALGRAALAEALELEFERLRQARIRVRLVRGTGVARISRPVQQLCFQVAREALSNVMRHAEATSVTVAIDRVGGVARISVSDNGRGMGAAAAGSGLAGLRERLELMGGSLRIDSRPGATTIVAEIPEPA